MIKLDIIPIKSANNPAFRAYLIFVMPTLPKYRVITYNVVSVLPCRVDATLPIKESGPSTLNISVMMTSEAEPLMGRRKAIGNIEVDMNFGNILVKGVNINSSKWLCRKIFTANTMLIVNGNIVIALLIPSFAPSIKAEYKSTFFIKP